MLLEKSEEFVPNCLKLLLLWIFDDKSYLSGTNDFSDLKLMNRVITLAECIIYCTRRGKKTQVIPPFHIGFMLQMEHDHGSRTLIEKLNFYGMCASYDELRNFLTCAVINQEINEDNIIVPSGIVKRSLNGLLIQEGNDNVDINVETIDGYNTYHTMARVIFQEQRVESSYVNHFKRIPRLNIKTLPDTEIDKYSSTIDYTIPTSRPLPPKYEDALIKVKDTMKSCNETASLKNMAWILLRNLNRGIYNFAPNKKPVTDQKIPMWTGFNTRISEPTNLKTIPYYLPSINEKPSELKTVYTVLKRGSKLAKLCDQPYSVHTFDQQLYAVAQDIKLNCSNEFEDSILRLGGFHTTSTLNSCIGKIWGDGGLMEMLVDPGVYASKTAENMLHGKQFHRSVRGLTLIYDALMSIMIENLFKMLETSLPGFDNLFNKIDQFENKYAMNENYKTDLD